MGNRQKEYITVKDGEFTYKFVDEGRAVKRARGFFTKEPETIEWISGFEKEAIFYDIGANLGVYSLYASKRVKRVFSVEPHIPTAATLLENVELNVARNVIVITSPAYSRTGCYRFENKSFVSGSSGHNISNNESNELKITTCIDDLVFRHGLDCPDYVKIDIDGAEDRVIDGMWGVLTQFPPKSILVEYNTDGGTVVEKYLKRFGYTYIIQHTATSKEKTDKGAKLEETPHNRLYVR
jgi:FkbM family methyltransferase